MLDIFLIKIYNIVSSGDSLKDFFITMCTFRLKRERNKFYYEILYKMWEQIK